MSNFLLALYSLKIKKIYDDIKDGIPKQLKKFEWIDNRKRMVEFSMKPVSKAYKEGFNYAKTYSKSFLEIDIPSNVKPKISKKDESALYKYFLTMIKNAEKIYKLRIDNLRNLAKLNHKRIDVKKGPQELQAWGEYVNAVKTATNNLIINAGEDGYNQVWESI